MIKTHTTLNEFVSVAVENSHVDIFIGDQDDEEYTVTTMTPAAARDLALDLLDAADEAEGCILSSQAFLVYNIPDFN